MNNTEIKTNNKKALIAMSGGVDSAVSALLALADGYSCLGVTMDLSQRKSSDNLCCTSQDILDAADVCKKLGIDHTVLALGEEFRRYVISYFVEAYIKGETPNPCVVCNKHLKFGSLLEYASKSGCDTVVTGHYASVKKYSDRYLLCRAKDTGKDQSYVLWTLTQDQLAHTFFPLGAYTKEEVRRIAESHGFVNAHKHDSQDICFIPDGDYVSFIERYCGRGFDKGDFTDTEGNVLGHHDGIVRYTPGQRKGLGIAFGRPMYVKSKDAAKNTVTLSSNEELFSDRLTVKNINLIALDRIDAPLHVEAKIRYNHKASPATVIQTDKDRLEIVFGTPQRAIAPGQSAVLYDGDVVIGGGIIE